MSDEAQSAHQIRPDKFRIEVCYAINIVGTWDGRDRPMNFGLEFPENLGEVEVSALDLLTGAPMRMELTSPKTLRKALEHAMGMGVKLAGGITNGSFSIKELMESAQYASLDGVELTFEERVQRLREIADEVAELKRVDAH